MRRISITKMNKFQSHLARKLDAKIFKLLGCNIVATNGMNPNNRDESDDYRVYLPDGSGGYILPRISTDLNAAWRFSCAARMLDFNMNTSFSDTRPAYRTAYASFCNEWLDELTYTSRHKEYFYEGDAEEKYPALAVCVSFSKILIHNKLLASEKLNILKRYFS